MDERKALNGQSIAMERDDIAYPDWTFGRDFYKPLLTKHDAQIFMAQTDADEGVSHNASLATHSQFDKLELWYMLMIIAG